MSGPEARSAGFWVGRVVLASLALLVGGPVAAEPPRPVERVDLQRYMGRWYEIAAIPNFFQRNCARDTTADYALRDDGQVSVTNTCLRASGETDQAQGVARVADPATNARLEVSFVSLLGFQLFWGDYWVIGLGKDYAYALIGTPSRRWGWILARDPHPSETQVQAWLAELKGQGYDPAGFVRTPQGGPRTP
jgi:apolipoprotein D and lipocalin family protein